MGLDAEDEYRFDENPPDHETYDVGGVGKWSTASAKKLGVRHDEPGETRTVTTATTKKEERVRIITPEFRASFPSLFQARKIDENNPNEKAKFSIQMIFRTAETPESKQRGEKVVLNDPQFALLRKTVEDLLAQKLGAQWREKVKERKGDGSMVYRLPFRDGNATEKKDIDGYGPGTVFVTASSTYRPGVIDGQKKEILNPQDVYGGCYARAEIHPYWYEVKGNKGVTFGLDNVQKIRDGEPFSGRSKAEDVFESIDLPEGTPAGAAGSGASTGDPMGGLFG